MRTKKNNKKILNNKISQKNTRYQKNIASCEDKVLKENKIKILQPWKVFVFSLIFIIWAFVELILKGETLWYFIFLVFGGIILLPNSIWIWKKMGVPFGLPYIFTMLKTKKFVTIINNLSKHAKIMEKISIIGLFLGFGLTGIDYWIARKEGGLKRILILLIGAILLGIVFFTTIIILFSTPIVAILLIPGLIFFILLGLGGLSLVFLIGYGIISIYAAFIGRQICPSVAPVIPGVPIPGIGMVIPLIAWVSLGLILIIHEGAHGIMLSYYKEKIKSVGLILVGILPMGAFVEQDDKTFNKRDERKQILVLSAGPSSNLFTLLIGSIIFILFVFTLSPFATEINKEFDLTYSGVIVKNVSNEVSFCGINETAPAKDNLFSGDVVLALNGVDINSIKILNETFAKSNNEMIFTVLRNNEEIDVNIMPVVFEDLGIKRIGVEFDLIKTNYTPSLFSTIGAIILSSIETILKYFLVLSFAVAMFNFMPSAPLDGGRIAKFVLFPYFSFMKFETKEETQKFIGRLFIWLFLISILLNLIPYLTMLF